MVIKLEKSITIRRYLYFKEPLFERVFHVKRSPTVGRSLVFFQLFFCFLLILSIFQILTDAMHSLLVFLIMNLMTISNRILTLLVPDMILLRVRCSLSILLVQVDIPKGALVHKKLFRYPEEAMTI